MPIYQIILVIAVVILVLSLLLNLLFSPITWIIIAILVIYSFIHLSFTIWKTAGWKTIERI